MESLTNSLQDTFGTMNHSGLSATFSVLLSPSQSGWSLFVVKLCSRFLPTWEFFFFSLPSHCCLMLPPGISWSSLWLCVALWDVFGCDWAHPKSHTYACVCVCVYRGGGFCKASTRNLWLGNMGWCLSQTWEPGVDQSPQTDVEEGWVQSDPTAELLTNPD